MSDHADSIRHAAFALFGAVGRLAFDHAKYEGINRQFFYELFRGFLMALIAVTLVDAVVTYFCVVGVVGSASATASGFFAREVMVGIRDLVPTLINKLTKKIK